MAEQFKGRFPWFSGNWKQFAHLFKRIEVPAKTVLLKEGDTARQMLFIESGCIRIWFNDNGRDVTMQFFLEAQSVSSYESFRTGQPSLFTVESIEPCVLHSLSKIDFMHIVHDSPAIREDMEEFTFRRWIYYQKLFLSRIKDSPQKRYEQLLQEQPELVQRVPQHYIASYLGITPVSLSRIRNKMAKQAAL